MSTLRTLVDSTLALMRGSSSSTQNKTDIPSEDPIFIARRIVEASLAQPTSEKLESYLREELDKIQKPRAICQLLLMTASKFPTEVMGTRGRTRSRSEDRDIDQEELRQYNRGQVYFRIADELEREFEAKMGHNDDEYHYPQLVLRRPKTSTCTFGSATNVESPTVVADDDECFVDANGVPVRNVLGG